MKDGSIAYQGMQTICSLEMTVAYNLSYRIRQTSENLNSIFNGTNIKRAFLQPI